MNIAIEEISPTRKAAVITIPADELVGYEKNVLKEFSNRAHVSGFRPGKVPFALLRQRYGEQIKQGFREETMNAVTKRLRENKSFDIYRVVDVNEGSVFDAAPAAEAVIRIEADIKVEFELPDYKSQKFDVPTEPVTDADVDKEVERIRTESSRFEVADRAAEKGDYVKLSYIGTIDGTPVKEIAPGEYLYGTQSATWEEAGTDAEIGIPEIIAGILGMKAGDKAEFTHEFPADYKTEALRGKKAVYAVEVFEVRARKLPELDEAFFKERGVKDLDELKAKARTTLQQQKETDAYGAKHEAATKWLLASVDFPMPESAIQEATNALFVTYAIEKIQSGVEFEEVKKEREEFVKGAKGQAIERVKLDLILERIAEKEDLRIGQNELAYVLEQEAYVRQKDPATHIREVMKNPEQLNHTYERVLRAKAMQLVIDGVPSHTESAASGDVEILKPSDSAAPAA